MDQSNQLRKKVCSLSAVIGGVTASGIASAVPLTLTDTISTSTHLSEGNSYAGMFDLNDLIPSSGEYNTPYNILSASVKAYGYSDADSEHSQTTSNYALYDSNTRQTSSGYRVYYSYRSCSWCSRRSGSYWVYSPRYATDNYFEREVVDKFTDTVRDKMGLTLGENSDSFSDAVDDHNTQRGLVNTSTEPTTGSYQSGWNYYRTDYIREKDIWSGDLQIEEILSSESITDLSLDGLLAFNLSALEGQFTLNSLELNVVIDVNPIASSIPEPDSLFLILAGLTGLSIRRMKTNGQPRYSIN